MSELPNPPRGMRDIVGEEAELYEYLFEEFRNTAKSRGFKPIITPTVEYFKLFEAKSGEEIKNSMYVFEDKAGRLLALRPEVTASVVRAYIRLMRGLPKPIRLYYIAQCFRYEEPQYARYREFWQGGLEIIGDADVNADVHVAITASEFLDRIGVKHFYKVGNVLIYRAFMKRMGLSEELQDHILHLIDKDLVERALEELRARVGDEGVNIIEHLVGLQDLDKVSSYIEEHKGFLGELYEQVEQEHSRMLTFIETLKELGYHAEYDPKLVRGLAYYTGLIFEYKAKHAEMTHSIGGGGRYDGLTTVYGAPFEYSTGLALGIDRIALVAKKARVRRSTLKMGILLLSSIPLHVGYRTLSLIPGGVEAFVYRSKSISKALEHASKAKCDYVLIIGEKELAANAAMLKDMRTGEQRLVSFSDLAGELVRLANPQGS